MFPLRDSINANAIACQVRTLIGLHQANGIIGTVASRVMKGEMQLGGSGMGREKGEVHVDKSERG